MISGFLIPVISQSSLLDPPFVVCDIYFCGCHDNRVYIYIYI